MLYVYRTFFDSWFKERVLFHVRLASLDLGLKERVMLHVQCACFDSWHDWTSCDSIGIDVFPMDLMDSIGRLSNPPQSIVYTSGFIL